MTFIKQFLTLHPASKPATVVQIGISGLMLVLDRVTHLWHLVAELGWKVPHINKHVTLGDATDSFHPNKVLLL